MSSQYLEYARTETKSKKEYVGFQNETIAPKQLRDQPFRIYRVVPDLNKVTVNARHVFYDLLDNMVKSLKPSSDTMGASVMEPLRQEIEGIADMTQNLVRQNTRQSQSQDAYNTKYNALAERYKKASDKHDKLEV